MASKRGLERAEPRGLQRRGRRVGNESEGFLVLHSLYDGYKTPIGGIAGVNNTRIIHDNTVIILLYTVMYQTGMMNDNATMYSKINCKKGKQVEHHGTLAANKNLHEFCLM